MKSYLVTGGVGFIGSHLVKSLKSDSSQIFVVDRRHREESPILRGNSGDGIEFVKLDLRDVEKTASLISTIKPDVIFHLAAQPLSTVSNIDPLNTVQDNIIATYSVLEAIRNCSPDGRLVHASSACFYGVPTSPPPLRETDAPAVGHYIYTATKIAADFAVQHYRHVYNLDCVVIRMVNVYGPGDKHFQRIVPRLILQGLNQDAPSLTQSDGSDVLSFLYVEDAVAALRLLDIHPHANKNAVWNIPASKVLSVTELMKQIFNLLGQSSQSFVAVGPRKESPVHKFLDGTMIKDELGFHPTTDLEDGLRRTIDWYRAYVEQINPHSSIGQKLNNLQLETSVG